jgi:hypothetical protein
MMSKRKECIDCLTCANYNIEDIEGSDWAMGVCDKGHELDPPACKDFEKYVEIEVDKD